MKRKSILLFLAVVAVCVALVAGRQTASAQTGGGYDLKSAFRFADDFDPVSVVLCACTPDIEDIAFPNFICPSVCHPQGGALSYRYTF